LPLKYHGQAAGFLFSKKKALIMFTVF